MDKDKKQDPTNQANDAAASLSFATHLQNQMMQHQNPAPQAPEQTPSEGEPKETEEKPEEKPAISKELTDFKKEIEGLLDSKLGDLKREIETAIADEPDEKETQTTETA